MALATFLQPFLRLLCMPVPRGQVEYRPMLLAFCMASFHTISILEQILVFTYLMNGYLLLPSSISTDYSLISTL